MMRDKSRIYVIIDKLISISESNESLSFCKLVTEVFKESIFFYLEDDKAESIIDDYISNMTSSNLEDTQQISTKVVLKELETFWLTIPDWRFMQVVINVLGSERNLLMGCDNKLVCKLIDYIKLS